MEDQNCAYCMEGELVAAFGIKICELESSKVYLFKEQSYMGRVIVACKKHVSEIAEWTSEERAVPMGGINNIACTMHEIFSSWQSKLWSIWGYGTSSSFPFSS